MSVEQTPQHSPAGIMALTTAHWGAQTLFTANRLGVFEAIVQGHQRAGEIAAACGGAERPVDLLLKACAALGLLEQENGKFRLSPAAAAFLVPGAPGFLGNAIRYSEDLYDTWGKLELSVREDRPALETSEYTGDDEQRTRHFVLGMHDRALGVGRVLVDLVDLGDCRSLLDVGGGPGTYASLFARKYPGLKCTVLDLPGVVAIASEIVADMGAAAQVDFLAGDFHETPFPAGTDAVIISGVFHRESEQGCRRLIERAAAALPPGGLLVVSDVFTDAGGCSPPMAALFGLNMLLTAPDGGVHEDVAVARWMTEAGFQTADITAFPPPMPHRVITGRKAADTAAPS